MRQLLEGWTDKLMEPCLGCPSHITTWQLPIQLQCTHFPSLGDVTFVHANVSEEVMYGWVGACDVAKEELAKASPGPFGLLPYPKTWGK